MEGLGLSAEHALFANLGASPSSIEAAKILDAFGCQVMGRNKHPHLVRVASQKIAKRLGREVLEADGPNGPSIVWPP